jgi:2-dehydropantoate 2-reductase
MKIAILGTGPIGSTFAFHLARAGHDVTAIARGKRLAELQAAGAIVTVDGRRADVRVSPALDPAVAFDLVLVTVLAPQVDAVLPALRASAATTVMFMFNTFASLDPLREAVGAARFAFGFPAVLAALPDGKLKFDVYTRGQTTLATDAGWAQVFTDAGIRTAVHDDIESWLRTHAVLIVAMMAMGSRAHERRAGISWAEAKTYARALREGFALVRRLGNAITPAPMGLLGRAPTSVVAGAWWGLSRLAFVRELGSIGPAEPRALIDAMSAAAPEHSATLRSIRP